MPLNQNQKELKNNEKLYKITNGTPSINLLSERDKNFEEDGLQS